MWKRLGLWVFGFLGFWTKPKKTMGRNASPARTPVTSATALIAHTHKNAITAPHGHKTKPKVQDLFYTPQFHCISFDTHTQTHTSYIHTHDSVILHPEIYMVQCLFKGHFSLIFYPSVSIERQRIF